jgi:hypothetical protein
LLKIYLECNVLKFDATRTPDDSTHIAREGSESIWILNLADAFAENEASAGKPVGNHRGPGLRLPSDFGFTEAGPEG